MSWPRGSKARDAIVALVLMGVGVAAIVVATGYPSRAANWPIAIWSLLILFSLILLLDSFRPGTRESGEEQL